MLFNSYEFIFVFLPIAFALFYLLGAYSSGIALGWLILASLVFYAWWNPANLLIITLSLALNYLCIDFLGAVRRQPGKERSAMYILWIGIAFNLALLGYFKYSNFLLTAANDFVGTDFVLHRLVLPLGISFFTFQQITVLVDVHGGKIETVRPRDYCLFVLFFPQLIAGPIVHYREMMPQFRAHSGRFNAQDCAVGMTLFIFGLFKKTVLADGISAHVAPIYDLAAGGGYVSMIPAWTAAVGFTLQIYFDFSGYTDMALGLARCFGVRLPQNFDSPLRSSSIIDFWSRWHITLTRFLTAYIYNPLALRQTRKRIQAGLPGLNRNHFEAGAFIRILAIPTILTMFLSGLWHGAGYLFIAWGTLHGLYLTINHGWRLVVPRLGLEKARYQQLMRPLGFVLTFLSVAVTMILFRATSLTAAGELLRGVFGLNGVILPQKLLELPVFSVLTPLVAGTSAQTPGQFAEPLVWTICLFFIAVALPNSARIMARYEPVLDHQRLRPVQGRLAMAWGVTLPWVVAVAVLAVTAVINISADSEFLYWQF